VFPNTVLTVTSKTLEGQYHNVFLFSVYTLVYTKN
jgi:hypothetical protein